LIGTYLDKYEVLQKIGEGGMATVYRARHSTLGREVAIKVLHPHLSAVARNRRRFAREARAIEHLDHENILKIFDYSGSDAEDCYIVTEFVEGQTLRQLIETRGLLPSEVAALIGARLADALRYAHESGIIHRDLKPENVMLRADGTVKLMDFGIARFLDESSVTMTGALVGSPAYMSPEQALERVLDPRSDLFSLGTLLFHLVTGQLPFTGTNPSIILRNIIEGNRRDVLDVQPGVAPRLADIIDRLMEPSPDARFDTAQAVEAALEAVLADAGLGGIPEWSLTTYLVDPDGYEDRLRTHLDQVLLEGGRTALRAGDHLIAQRMFNRLLAQDPHHEEVLTLLSDLHTHGDDPADEGRRLAGLGGAALVLVLGVTAWWWMVPQDAPVPSAAVDELPIRALRAAEPLGPDELVAAPRPRGTRVARTETLAEPAPADSEPGRVSQAAVPRPVVVAASEEAPVAEPEPEPVAPAPAWVLVTLAKPGYADVFVDGERVGRTPKAGGNRFETTAGHHELLLSNPAGTDFRRTFDVEAGETVAFTGVLLRRKAVRVAFRGSLEDACVVRQNERELGTLTTVGRTHLIEDLDRLHVLEIRCPSGFSDDLTIGPKQAGTVVYVGEVP